MGIAAGGWSALTGQPVWMVSARNLLLLQQLLLQLLQLKPLRVPRNRKQQGRLSKQEQRDFITSIWSLRLVPATEEAHRANASTLRMFLLLLLLAR